MNYGVNMAKNQKAISRDKYTCETLKSKIKFYENLMKLGRVKEDGGAANRLADLKAKKLLLQIQKGASSGKITNPQMDT